MKTIRCKKLFRIICMVVAMLVLITGIAAVPTYAASPGIYVATATPHYRHPTTGVIEDSGGESSAVLGQSMTESATHTQALVEVDSSGNTYVTIRLKLMDNIQNPTFQVDGSSVSATLMQENYSANTADYRMKVKSESSVIRVSMYVTAMGRQVIFYITLSNLQSGSGDFITSITVEQTTAATSGNSSSGSSSSPSSGSSSLSSGKSTASTTSSSGNSAAATTAAATTAAAETSADDSESDESDETETLENDSEEETEAGGLEIYDASGNAVTEESEASDSEGTGSAVVWIIAAAAVVVILAGGCIYYFCFYRKRAR